MNREPSRPDHDALATFGSRRDWSKADADVAVDLQRLQKTLFGDARDAPIGQQIEILTLRLDQDQPHLCPAFDAGHLDGGLKACAGRGRPGYLQHRILGIRWRKRNATHSDRRPTLIMSDSRHNGNGSIDRRG